MSTFARLRARVAGSGLVIADQALVSGASFATTILLVRALGLDGFGRFSLLWMGVLGLLALQQAVVGTPLLSIGPKHAPDADPAEARDYDTGVLRLELAFLAVALAAALGALAPLAHAAGVVASSHELAAAACAALARAACDFVRQHGFARERRKRVLALDVLAYGGQLAALAVLHVAGALTPLAAWTAIAGANALGAVAGLASYPCWRGSPGALGRVCARHLGMSRWLACLALLQWFTSNAFALAAGAVLGPAAVGAIKAGQTILGALHVLLLAVENVVPVRAAALAARGTAHELAAYFRRVWRDGGLLTLAAAAFIAVSADPLARLVYGSASADQVLAIRAFALHYVCVFAITLVTIRLRTEERTRPVFVAQALGAAFAAAGAHAAVEVFGLAGALAGIVLQQVLVLLVLVLALRGASEARRPLQAARAGAGSAVP